jgi:lipopolysaccharide export system permease protein
MGVAFRYILRQIAIMMLSITLGLTLAIWLSQCLRYLSPIVAHGLPLGLSFKFLALLLPTLLILILPVAMFIAVAFVYQKLILDRELVVLRACGVSQMTLARPALVLALLVTLACYALSLYFVPLSMQAFKDFRHQFLSSYGQFLVQEGVFTALGPGLTVYARERDDEGGLRGLLIEDARDPKKPITYTATVGKLESMDGGLIVRMLNGTSQQRDPSTNKVSILNFDDASIEVDTNAQRVGAREHTPEEMFIGELLNPSQETLQTTPITMLRAVAHTNLAMPLYALTFTVIGLALILNSSLQRRDRNLRILVAVAVVTLLQVGAVSLRNLAGKESALLPLLYVGPLLPTVVGFAAIGHLDGWLRIGIPRPRPRSSTRLLEQPQPG